MRSLPPNTPWTRGGTCTYTRPGSGEASGAGTRALAEAGAPVIEGSAEILREWGVAPRARRAQASEDGLPEGDRLAMLLKEEIDGNCALKGGEAFWRA